MMTAKETVLDMVQQLPPDVTYETVLEALEHLALQADLQAAQQDIEAGRLISQSQLEQESAAWSSTSVGLSAPATH